MTETGWRRLRLRDKTPWRFTFTLRLPLLAALMLVPLLAACGGAEATPTRQTGSGTGSTGASPTPARPTGTPVGSPAGTPSATAGATPGANIQHPSGANDLVLLVDLSGGFVPVETLVTSLPLVALYGDGRMITPGPQIAIFPPPALPNLRVTRLNEAGIQAILREAQTAGLMDGDKRYNVDRIADAQWTEITTVANGRTSHVAVYALGLDVPTNEIPADQREARTKVQDFLMKLTSADSWLPSSAIVERDAEYQIDRLQIVTTPVDTTATPTSQDIRPQRLDWPLTSPLSELGNPYSQPSPNSRCAVLQGQDLTTVLGALRGANSLTQWASAGQTYNVFARPLLPHETGCTPRS